MALCRWLTDEGIIQRFDGKGQELEKFKFAWQRESGFVELYRKSLTVPRCLLNNCVMVEK